MKAFRIADRRFPVFDGTGARIVGGRWNSPGRELIYAAETFALALLELLVHSNLGRVPMTHVVVEIEIPDDITVEILNRQDVPGWDAEEQIASRAFGDDWLMAKRSAVLMTPSVVTGGRERNVLINPRHADFIRIVAGAPEDVRWDPRFSEKVGRGLRA